MDHDVSRERTDALGLVLALEEDIAARASRGREDAEVLVAQARREVEAAQESLNRELVEARRGLRLRIESRHRAELEAIRERARKDAAELESCDEGGIAKLADGLLELILAWSSEPGAEVQESRHR